MPRNFALIGLLTLAAVASARPATAFETFSKLTVTSTNAASNGFTVFVRRGKAANDSMVHFRVARTEPSPDDRHVFSCHLRINDKVDLNSILIERRRNDQPYWEIDVPAASLADTELRVDLITRISGRVADTVHYAIYLGDFVPAAVPAKESVASQGT